VVKATSKASADSPIARRRWQAEIEAGLAASEIPHTLLRSNAYMQNVLALASAIAQTSSFGSSAGQGRSGLVDARDVAAAAAEIAAAPAGHAGQTYWLTGPGLISNYDVAASADGRPVPGRAQQAGGDGGIRDGALRRLMSPEVTTAIIAASVASGRGTVRGTGRRVIPAPPVLSVPSVPFTRAISAASACGASEHAPRNA
jgi:uncharacterized protein YbjT (DUF2867 family)